jgi:hypothetical protein
MSFADYPEYSDLTDDILELSLPSRNTSSDLRSYRVLSYILSELDIRPGDVITLRTVTRYSYLSPFSIVAAEDRSRLSSRLILRMFLPPALLICNSDDILVQPSRLGPEIRVLAFLPLEQIHRDRPAG